MQSIKIDNIDLEKEQKIVEFAIFEETINLIKEWLRYRNDNTEYLLITKYNGVFKQMSKSTIRDRVKKIGKLVGKAPKNRH